MADPPQMQQTQQVNEPPPPDLLNHGHGEKGANGTAAAPVKQEKHKADGNTSFLRAAKAGNLEKVLEYLKGSTDINTSNANGLNALHLSSKEGHINIVTELLSRGANVDASTKKGNTALHIASLAGQNEIVKILVQSNAKVNVQSQNGFTPLYMAAQENHSDVVKFLLANGASQTLATEDGFTPLAVALQQGHDRVVTVLLENDTRSKVRLPALHIAAKKDDVKAARLLLENEHNSDTTSKTGNLVNDTTKSGFTPLHIASHYGNINVGRLLIERKADVDFKARNEITPLHVASKWGRSNMVTLLAESKADLECKTKDGLTPLHCATRSGHDQIVDLLIEKGADVGNKTKNGLTPLHMAAQGDHVECARIMLYNKAPIDEVTVDYLTPLHVAAHCGNVRTAKLLLDKKCEVNARALNGFTPLHIACKKNRIKVVELLLKYGASIEATTESGLTPLHVASFMGHMNIVIYLIQHGASPDTPTVRGETALHLAARANQTDIIRILLRNGATVDAKAREQQTPLHIASRLGNTDICSVLLQHGAAPDATTKDNYTPLHIAAKEGQQEVAAVLLEHGASQNLMTKKGFTPLHIAAKYGNLKVVALLLQKDADPNIQGKNGLTPLHVSAHYNHPAVAQLLLENKASPHSTAKNGYTPLHIAAKKNEMDIATTLLEYGAKPNADSKNGFTPLHLASQEGHTDMVSLLLERGSDVNMQAKNGLTPMHLAAQEDKVPVAEILKKHNGKIDPTTKAGYTPLHTACHFGQINMIRFLLEHEAAVDAETKLGYTPLHQAAQQGHVLVINLLLRYNADPNAVNQNGQTPLTIAQRLGYISVVEILKHITEVTTTTTTTEEKYKVVSPETMQETLMTDSEDEGGTVDLMPPSPALGLNRPLSEQHIYLPFYEGRTTTHLEPDTLHYEGDSVSRGDSRTVTLTRMYRQTEKAFDDTTLGDQSMSVEDMKFLADDSIMPAREEKMQSAAAPQAYAERSISHLDDANRTSAYDSYTGDAFNSSMDADNIPTERNPVYSGFLVSFMVDARGGAMCGCRHSGVRIIIPPGKASMPTRVTCKLVKREKLTHPPPLMESEALCSRILQMGPVGAKFRGPVVIEVPHYASLRGKEREIAVLRSDNGQTWREHTADSSEAAIASALGGSFEELESAEELYNKRVSRILTTDFPQYFAIVTRVRQEVSSIGTESAMLSSTVVPQVQAVFPDGALTKKIKVGLQAQPIGPELVSKMLGNRVAVSPIVTVEPRRRKFHKPITLTIPLPKAAQKGMMNQYSGTDTPSLRLLCSITGGATPAQWEDITGTTPLTFVQDCVSFTTTVSARFWLMDCQNINEAAKMATELYREAIHVPFMSKFVVFAKRTDVQEARLRVFCMTDDKMEKTLEKQEHFEEVARSRDVEVLEGKPQYVEMAGNLVPVTKSGDQLYINFHGFRENRLPFVVRVRDLNQDPAGRIAFMKEPRVNRGDAPQTPICNLNVILPDSIKSETSGGLDDEALDELKNKFDQQKGDGSTDSADFISKAELRLTDIAEALQGDWVPLAQCLGIDEEDITKTQNDYSYVSEQALIMLHLWIQKKSDAATGNELERALRKIGREDVIRKCMYNVEEVTDEQERNIAQTQMDQDGFDALKTEMGSSRGSSMARGLSLDVSYDEKDLMKDSESIGEESPGELTEDERRRVESQITEEAVAPVEEDRPKIEVDEMIKSMEATQDFGMDERRASLSSSSDGSMIVREDEADQDLNPKLADPDFFEPTQTSVVESSVRTAPEPTDDSLPIDEMIEPEESSRQESQLPVEPEPEPEITTEVFPCDDIQQKITEDMSENDVDGKIVRKHTTTIEHFQPVTEVKRRGDLEVERNETEQYLGKEIKEDVTEFPSGCEDYEDRQFGVTKSTSVKSSEQTLEDGTWQKNTTTTLVITVDESEPTTEILPVDDIVQQRVDEEDNVQELDDGTVVKTHTTTTTHYRNAYKVTKQGNVELDRQEIEEHIGTEIYEDVLETPAGVTDLEDIQRSVSKKVAVRDESGTKEDGTWFTKKTTTTTVTLLSEEEVNDLVAEGIEPEQSHIVEQSPPSDEVTTDVIPVDDEIKQRTTEEDKEEIRNDVIIKTHTTTTTHFKDAIEVKRAGDVELERNDCEQLIGTEVEIRITEVPEGVDVEDNSQSYSRKTSEQQSEKTEADGTWYKQNVITTTIAVLSDEHLIAASESPAAQEEIVKEVQETQPDGTVITKRIVVKRIGDSFVRYVYIVHPDGSVVLDMQTQHGINETVPSELFKENNILKPLSLSDDNDGFNIDYVRQSPNNIISKVPDEVISQAIQDAQSSITPQPKSASVDAPSELLVKHPVAIEEVQFSESMPVYATNADKSPLSVKPQNVDMIITEKTDDISVPNRSEITHTVADLLSTFVPLTEEIVISEVVQESEKELPNGKFLKTRTITRQTSFGTVIETISLSEDGEVTRSIERTKITATAKIPPTEMNVLTSIEHVEVDAVATDAPIDESVTTPSIVPDSLPLELIEPKMTQSTEKSPCIEKPTPVIESTDVPLDVKIETEVLDEQLSFSSTPQHASTGKTPQLIPSETLPDSQELLDELTPDEKGTAKYSVTALTSTFVPLTEEVVLSEMVAEDEVLLDGKKLRRRTITRQTSFGTVIETISETPEGGIKREIIRSTAQVTPSEMNLTTPTEQIEVHALTTEAPSDDIIATSTLVPETLPTDLDEIQQVSQSLQSPSIEKPVPTHEAIDVPLEIAVEPEILDTSDLPQSVAPLQISSDKTPHTVPSTIMEENSGENLDYFTTPEELEATASLARLTSSFVPLTEEVVLSESFTTSKETLADGRVLRRKVITRQTSFGTVIETISETEDGDVKRETIRSAPRVAPPEMGVTTSIEHVDVHANTTESPSDEILQTPSIVPDSLPLELNTDSSIKTDTGPAIQKPTPVVEVAEMPVDVTIQPETISAAELPESSSPSIASDKLPQMVPPSTLDESGKECVDDISNLQSTELTPILIELTSTFVPLQEEIVINELVEQSQKELPDGKFLRTKVITRQTSFGTVVETITETSDGGVKREIIRSTAQVAPSAMNVVTPLEQIEVMPTQREDDMRVIAEISVDDVSDSTALQAGPTVLTPEDDIVPELVDRAESHRPYTSPQMDDSFSDVNKKDLGIEPEKQEEVDEADIIPGDSHQVESTPNKLRTNEDDDEIIPVIVERAEARHPCAFDETDIERDISEINSRQLDVDFEQVPVDELDVVPGEDNLSKDAPPSEIDECIPDNLNEQVMFLPPEIVDQEGVQSPSDFDEIEETLADGTVVKRKLLKTKVKKIITKKIRRVGPDGDIIEDIITEEVPESEFSDTSSLRSSLSGSCCDFASSVPSISSPAEPDYHDEDSSTVRVYTDTIEGDPQVETDVQEFEETLPDGTIIKRKVIKTRQKQTIVKRVVMEGPELDLPTTEEQAQLMLNQGNVFEPEVNYYTDKSQSEPEQSTNVEEYEDIQPDGTKVTRKIVRTTEQQLTTERTMKEGLGSQIPSLMGVNLNGKSNLWVEVPEESIMPEDASQAQGAIPAQNGGHNVLRSPEPEWHDIDPSIMSRSPPCVTIPDEHADAEDCFMSPSTIASDTTLEFEDAQDMEGADGVGADYDGAPLDDQDQEDQTTRIVMKKRVHKKTIIRDGKEETIVTEDAHITQDDEGPEELRDSMQHIIEQFLSPDQQATPAITEQQQQQQQD